jgi:Tfp pilus assembly protein PilP
MTNDWKPDKSLTKEKILNLASREGGFKIHPNDRQREELLGRFKIFEIRGMVKMKVENGHFCFVLAKDTLLL